MEHGCRFYTHVVGSNPQTGGQIDTWDCAIAWIPILMIENSNEQRKTAASVQSFRNEMVKQQGILIQLACGEEPELIPDGNKT